MIFTPTVQSVLPPTSHQTLFLFSFVSIFSLVPPCLPPKPIPHAASGLIHVPLGGSTTEAYLWPPSIITPVPVDRERLALKVPHNCLTSPEDGGPF